MKRSFVFISVVILIIWTAIVEASAGSLVNLMTLIETHTYVSAAIYPDTFTGEGGVLISSNKEYTRMTAGQLIINTSIEYPYKVQEVEMLVFTNRNNAVDQAMLLLIPTQFNDVKAFKAALENSDRLIGEVRLAADWIVDGKSFNLHEIRYEVQVFSETDGVLLITASRLSDS